jgi:hypothetical protein
MYANRNCDILLNATPVITTDFFKIHLNIIFPHLVCLLFDLVLLGVTNVPYTFNVLSPFRIKIHAHFKIIISQNPPFKHPVAFLYLKLFI